MSLAIIQRLDELWEDKFPDAEAKRWARKFEKHPTDQVIAALEWWKDYKKFAPKIGEIERRLVEMENDSKRVAGKTINTDQRVVDVIRSQQPDLNGMDDWETIVRHWRSIWLRYHAGAEKRRGKITDAATLTFHDRQDFGFAEKCKWSCLGGLVGEWLRKDWAEAVARSVVASPDDYDRILNDLRSNLPGLRAEATQKQRELAEEQAIQCPPSLTFRPIPKAPDAQTAKVTAIRQLTFEAQQEPSHA